jgi:hypothetical protein
MKRLTTVVFFAVVALGLCASHEGAAQGVTDDLNSLGLYVGVWKAETVSKDTAYSKAGKRTSETTCNWGPNHGFLICDQIVHNANGDHNDLSIYTYNEKDHTFAFYGLSRDNPPVRAPKFTVEGKRWTYSSEFDDGGKHIRQRTINEFTSPDSVTYRGEYSEDGTNWIVMFEGSNKRVK